MLLIGCLISVLANSSGISWQLLLLVEETGVPREKQTTCNWWTDIRHWLYLRQMKIKRS